MQATTPTGRTTRSVISHRNGQRQLPSPHRRQLFVPVARLHHEVLDAQPDQAPVPHETKRSGFVAAMHHVVLLHLLGHPRDEGLWRKALGRLRRRAVDLAHHDVLAPVGIDAELDQPVQFYALWGSLRRRGGVFVGDHRRSDCALSALLTTQVNFQLSLRN